MKKLTKKQQLLQLQTKHLLLLGVLVTVVCVWVWYGLARAATPAPVERLVTVYDRGVEQSVLTTATTVRTALWAAEIEIDPNDIIEPSILTKLDKTSADIIIYRARPVAVVDGAVRQTVMTPLQSPNEIVQAAGLEKLGPKDKTTFAPRDVIADGVETKLIVSRQQLPKPKKIVMFQPKPNALTAARGAQVYVDGDGVAHRETYYDLPMNIVIGACGAGNGYTIRSDGAKIDKDGYILVAASYASYPRCSIVDTSMGPGKVYDTGGFALRHPYGFDLATDWTNFDGR